MNAQEKLKEIENREYKDLVHFHRCREQDRTWLISRVKTLEAELEVIAGDLKCIHYVRARKALEEDGE